MFGYMAASVAVTGELSARREVVELSFLTRCFVAGVFGLMSAVAGWVAVGRMRRWRLEQAAALPLLHADLVEARHQLLQQAYDVDRQAQGLADRLDTGGRDMAVHLIGVGFSRLTGRATGFWGPLVARLVVGRMGAERGG